MKFVLFSCNFVVVVVVVLQVDQLVLEELVREKFPKLG
jgi:hypothetical protein